MYGMYGISSSQLIAAICIRGGLPIGLFGEEALAGGLL
jgi:hypothetical protein